MASAGAQAPLVVASRGRRRSLEVVVVVVILVLVLLLPPRFPPLPLSENGILGISEQNFDYLFPYILMKSDLLCLLFS